ncbi:MAG: putative ABC transporter permease [Bacilli bacterium]|nr:putative ABC transporter permease [Bacilli bacterium]
MYTFYKYFLIFFIYSILGWIAESIYSSILEKKLVDRGFLIGPYCPIYGTGAVIGITYLTQYKNNPLTIFILGIVISCIIEYITSYLMEKIFKARWWDYSNHKFNLNGRICGKNALLFGICSLLIIYICNPPIELILSRLNNQNLKLISLISFIIFISDVIISYNIINKLKINLNKIEINKDSTYEIKALVLAALNTNINGKIKKNTLQKRLIKAFPTLDINKYIKKQNERISNIKRLFK